MVLVLVAFCHGAFQNVPCEYTCPYEMPGHVPIMLMCENNVCKCKNDMGRVLMDAPLYRVELQGDKCAIDHRGPCGTKNGVEISCKNDLECLQGTCRDTKAFGKTPLNHSCLDTQDCQAGLVCKMTRFYFRPMYYCVTPDTPVYDPKNPNRRP